MRDHEARPNLGDPNAPLPARAEIVIVGAGVIGLAIAYNLAKLGVTDVVLLERGYLAAGASGRNGGGIRQQWSTEINIRLMRESVALCREFAKDTGVNVWFRQGGYLFLSRTADETAKLEKNVNLQRKCGVPTRMLTPAEAKDLVPELEVGGFHAACYNPSDGVLFPWPFLWGYARGALGRGAKLFTFTDVTAIEREKHGGYAVKTSRGGSSGFAGRGAKGPLIETIRAPKIINAAGAWSPQIARMLGLDLPNWPMRHEICSSEPLKPFLKPMVSIQATGLYFSQSMRGEIVGGVGLHGDPSTLAMGSRLKFLAGYAKQLCAVMPSLAELKVLRQWAGPYDLTKDGNPLLGEPPGLPGFYLCCGFTGHGFMMAPVIGKLYAEWLSGGARHEIFDRCTLERFSRGDLIEHEDFIIG